MRLIDADSLKEGIKELKRSPWYNNDINPSWQQGIKDAVHVIETLCIDKEPTVDAVPKWIPCSERLPQTTWQFSDCESFKLIDNEVVPVGVYSCYESDPVLVCGSYDGKSGIFTAIYDEWKHEDGAVETGWRDNAEAEAEYMVIAWMPLPKPYDAERKEE